MEDCVDSKYGEERRRTPRLTVSKVFNSLSILCLYKMPLPLIESEAAKAAPIEKPTAKASTPQTAPPAKEAIVADVHEIQANEPAP